MLQHVRFSKLCCASCLATSSVALYHTCSSVTQMSTKTGKWGIWVLAFTTTLREGLEAVVFIAGVSAGLPVSSIPIPAVIGVIMGLSIGFILYWT